MFNNALCAPKCGNIIHQINVAQEQCPAAVALQAQAVHDCLAVFSFLHALKVQFPELRHWTTTTLTTNIDNHKIPSILEYLKGFPLFFGVIQLQNIPAFRKMNSCIFRKIFRFFGKFPEILQKSGKSTRQKSATRQVPGQRL